MESLELIVVGFNLAFTLLGVCSRLSYTQPGFVCLPSPSARLTFAYATPKVRLKYKTGFSAGLGWQFSGSYINQIVFRMIYYCLFRTGFSLFLQAIIPLL